MAKKQDTAPLAPVLDVTPPASMRRAGRLTSLLIAAFLVGLFYLAYVLVSQSPEYMAKAGRTGYGIVCDRFGDVLYDGTKPLTAYPAGHFADVGNLIGDTSGQMNNTLIARNLGALANYSFLYGSDGHVTIQTTLSHKANQAVCKALGSKDGTVIAYNWKTGELLCCVSKPGLDIAKGYANIDSMPKGSLLCKAFYPTVPGSTQKVSTLIAAYQACGIEKINALQFSCKGSFLNAKGQLIKCHKSEGHGTQTLSEAFANSCNPYFAQLVQSPMLPLSSVIETYTQMGYSVNGAAAESFEMDGIRIAAASTELLDQNDFDTQWGCLGQGRTLVSPFQLMLFQGAIANGTGRAVMPHLVDTKTDIDGSVTAWHSGEPQQTGQLFTSEAAKAVQAVMTENAAKHYNVSLPAFSCGVKSGTAQVAADGKEQENSLLAGFCLDADCPVAFCILIEARSTNDITTAQIAKTLLTSLKGVS